MSISHATLHSFEGKTEMLGATTKFSTINLLEDNLAISVSQDGLLIEVSHVEEEIAV